MAQDGASALSNDPAHRAAVYTAGGPMADTRNPTGAGT